MRPHDAERLQKLLQALAAGRDPGRLLDDAVQAAVAACGGRGGLIAGNIDGKLTPLASAGAVPSAVFEAAERAMATNAMSRQSDAASGAHSIAEPLRVNGAVIGAMAVGGDMKAMDATPLVVFAAAASLVLPRRPIAPSISAADVLAAVAGIAADADRSSVYVRVFDAAERLFAASAGFITVFEESRAVVTHSRGLDRADLHDASRDPEFRSLVGTAVLRVDAADHPVIGRLARGTEVAVGLPLRVAGRSLGHLMVLVPDEPDAAGRRLLTAFAEHVALSLRTADLYRRIVEKEEQVASVVHSIAHPVVVVDGNGCFQFINGAASEVFHLAGGFDAGQPVAGRLGNEVLEALLTGVPAAEPPLVTVGERMYRASVHSVVTSSGRDQGRVLVLDDVTAARETEQLKADFVSVIGHELRTPLTIMKGFIRTLQRRQADIDDATRESALHTLATNADRLEGLIKDLLLVSAIETATRVDLVTEDITAVARTYADDRVSVKAPSQPVTATFDRDKVTRILQHLIDNARKHSEGEITVEVKDGDEEVEVAVTDSGAGIFSGDIPRLFERFQQLDGTSTRAAGGTGIGLYLCRRLVEAQGGRIWCESRLGVGSRFSFALPKHGLPEVAPAPA